MKRVFTLDLHSHLNEKNIDPKEYWKRVKKIGLDAVAITEHANYEPKKAFEKLLKYKPKKLLLIPGSELNSEHGHLLCYGRDKDFFEHKELFEDKVPLKTVLKTVKENNFLLSIPHPWGFNYDSYGFTIGFEKLEELILSEQIGVETYNGMIGNLSNFIFDTKWVVKPVNFLDFLEKNRLTKKTGITRLTGKLKNKIDLKRQELVERCTRAIDLGEKASFVTAGSDGHSAKRIGEGILKIKSNINELSNENVFEEIKKKQNVIWYGPLVKEVSPGIFQRADKPFDNKEILQGLKYASASVIGKVKKRVSNKD